MVHQREIHRPEDIRLSQRVGSISGHYRNENPWIGSTRIILRKGKLMMDGAVPLEPGEGGMFHLRDEEHDPEWVRFGESGERKSDADETLGRRFVAGDGGVICRSCLIRPYQ